MKTMYIKPETKVLKINTGHQLLAGSPGYGGSTSETSGNLSRRGDSFWDEDEE
ncbi:MAG: toxin PIN [Prevotella sp.]|nr:toxin PIN [Prevotella sp.]